MSCLAPQSGSESLPLPVAYVATYLARDVRHILNLVDLATFQTFLRLCAGRADALVNLDRTSNRTR